MTGRGGAGRRGGRAGAALGPNATDPVTNNVRLDPAAAGLNGRTEDGEYLGLFGEQEQDEEPELESELGDLLRYLLLLLPLTGGVGGGVGRLHRAVRSPSPSVEALAETFRASSVLGSLSEPVLVGSDAWFSETPSPPAASDSWPIGSGSGEASDACLVCGGRWSTEPQ